MADAIDTVTRQVDAAERMKTNAVEVRGWVVALAMACAGGAAACASSGMPPGGPPDITPPVVLSVSPLSMTVDSNAKDLELKFDEVISETPKSVADLRQLVFISPRTGEEEVKWHRDRITIRPKGGWKKNTVYSVQVSPGLQDLRNNAIDTSITVVFSTGTPIPTTNITGVAFDWVAGRGANRALIEAMAADSTTYQVLSDTAGRFDLRHAPIGEYRIRAIMDRNNNRMLDPTEAFDTARITLTQRATVDLYAFAHDTVGLRIADIQVPLADSLRVIRVSFDKPLFPDQELNRTQFTVRDADSADVEVVLVQSAATRAVIDSARQKNRVDSIAAARPRDTTPEGIARADSVARRARTDSLAAAERAAREARRQATLRGGRPLPPPDTVPLPKMNRPKLSNDVYITLAARLKYATPYRLRVGGVTSLSGTSKSPERSFVTPKEPVIDTTRGPTRRPPP